MISVKHASMYIPRSLQYPLSSQRRPSSSMSAKASAKRPRLAGARALGMAVEHIPEGGVSIDVELLVSIDLFGGSAVSERICPFSEAEESIGTTL